MLILRLASVVFVYSVVSKGVMKEFLNDSELSIGIVYRWPICSCSQHTNQSLYVDGGEGVAKPEGRSRPFSFPWSFIILETFSTDVYIC